MCCLPTAFPSLYMDALTQHEGSQMINDKRPILVFGATGQQGGAVASALLKAGWPVRAMVRDLSSAKSIALRDEGAELVQGLFTDIDVMRAAMKDANGVFSVLPGNLAIEDEVRVGGEIADMASESGVAHLVYSSGASVGNEPTGVARFDAKGRVEAHIRTLTLTATIVRPVIFMEMLARPGFGLEKGRFNFFVRPDQSVQLIAVEDIGNVVAAIFADKMRFGGKTFKIAGDTVTGCELEAVFSEVAGRPIAYARFSEDDLAANPGFAPIAASLEDGPLADHVDLNFVRKIYPEILSFRSWLSGAGREALSDALGYGSERTDRRV